MEGVNRCTTPKAIKPAGPITETFAMTGLAVDIAKKAQEEVIRLDALIESVITGYQQEIRALRDELDILRVQIGGRP